jgi:molybdopterin-guanine dinucleotide biosynthesis protein A
LQACRTSILCPEEIGINDAEEQSFFNINTPADAAQAEALVAPEFANSKGV